MSYVKLHSAATDFSSGIQSVNQLRDNFQSVYDSFALEHGVREPYFQGGVLRFPPNSEGFGHHNTPKVCRAVVRTDLYTSSASTIFPGAIAAQQVVAGIARLSTGVFIIGIVGLREFYAVTEATQTAASSQRLTSAVSGFGGNGAPVGITIECYQKAASGGGLTLTDFDFVAHIYGTIV